MDAVFDDIYIMNKVINTIDDVLDKSYINTIGLADNQKEDIMQAVWENCNSDIQLLVKNDPAAQNANQQSSYQYVINTYSCVEAVINYRVANYIYYDEDIDASTRIEIARKLSEEIKNRLSIDIHPAAKIGVPFVLDHGFGTVIGQTAEIGKNCYFLNCVTLGGPGIGHNPQDERHPMIGDNVQIGIQGKTDTTIGDRVPFIAQEKIDPNIGDNVQIGAHVGIYGRIKIGNNVRINPCCLIGVDIPDNHIVTVSNQIQSCHPLSETGIDYNMTIYGIIPDKNNQLLIFGDKLSVKSAYFVDKEYNRLDFCDISIVSSDETKATLKLSIKFDCDGEKKKLLANNVKLVINMGGYEMLIMKSAGIKKVIQSCICSNGGR